MGNKLLPIDSNQVRKLAGMACTHEEIAHIVGCCRDTLEKRFPAELKEGGEEVSISIKRKQFKVALEDENVTMLIWLGKQYADQSDKREIESKVDINLAFKPHIHGPVLTDPKLRAQALALEEDIEHTLRIAQTGEEGGDEAG